MSAPNKTSIGDIGNSANSWTTFGERMPQLGMKIDVMAEDVPRLNLGKLNRIEDLGGGWIGFHTEHTIGAAVRLNYQWRETYSLND